MWWRRCLHRRHGAITDPGHPRAGRTEGDGSTFGQIPVNRESDTPVLIGERVRGLEPKADLVVAGGTDLLRSDLEYDLGITGAMKIAHLGEALGMDVEIHASGPVHRARMSAMRNTNWGTRSPRLRPAHGIRCRGLRG
jgi:L-alanine-DL-glutamate epimerase-like enolase superfamily enzyme